jgi:hypothetical protein
VVAASASAYTPPRLEDGQPDLQGNWVAYNRTPLARPDWLTELYITEEQAREMAPLRSSRSRSSLARRSSSPASVRWDSAD